MPALSTMRLLLVAVIAGYILAGGGLAALTSWTDYRQSLEQAQEMARNFLGVLEEHTLRSFDACSLILDAVRYSVLEAGLTETVQSLEFESYLRKLLDEVPHVSAVWLHGPDGATLLSVGAPLPPRDVSNLELFRSAAREDVMEHIAPPFSTELTDYITLSYPVIGADDELIAVAVALMPVNYFIEFYRSLGLSPMTSLGLVRLDGTIIARYPPPPAPNHWRLVHGERLEAMVAESETGSYIVENDVRRLVAFSKVSDMPLVVFTSFSYADILANWSQRFSRNIALAAVALAAVAALSWVTLRGIMRQEDALVEANERLEQRVAERTAELEGIRRTLEQRVVERTHELQEALQAREVLFRELHHRVKNNLQVVSSLLTMQSIRFTDPELRTALRETSERVQSMGMIHEMLYRRDQADQVRLDDYLETLADSLAGSYGARERGIEVTVEAEPRLIPLDQAVPIALIVTEVLSNAFKHAFADGRRGEVTVTLHGVDGALRLAILDTGKGLGPGRPGGIGLNLVRVLAAQLGAEMRYEDRTDRQGTIFELSLKS